MADVENFDDGDLMVHKPQQNAHSPAPLDDNEGLLSPGMLRSDEVMAPDYPSTTQNPWSHSAGLPGDASQHAKSDMDPLGPFDQQQYLHFDAGDAAPYSPGSNEWHGAPDGMDVDGYHQGSEEATARSFEPPGNDVQPLPDLSVQAQEEVPLHDEPVVPKKTKKSKKKKRKARPQNIPEDDAPGFAPPDQTIAATAADHIQEVPNEDYQYTQANVYGQQYSQPAPYTLANLGQQYIRPQNGDMDDGLRPHEQTEYPDQLATPRQDQYIIVSSPHSQLHEDLQAAASTSREAEAAPYWSAPPNGNPNASNQHRKPYTSMFAARPLLNTPPITQAMRAQPVPNPAFQDNTSHNPTSHIDDNPANEPPSSDIEDSFQHIRRKLIKKPTQQITQLTAEKQALQNELQQAEAAKRGLEDRLSTLRDEKENLAISFETEKGAHQLTRSKIVGFKKYHDALKNDMEKLKKDADAYHKHKQSLLAEPDRASQQMAPLVDKSQRLNDEAIKLCRDADTKLSMNAIRTTHLQENLKQQTDALAEEKTLRLQLQGQINTIEHVKDAMLRQMKSDKDSVLDKLYEIHATLEDTDNRQEVTEMLEKTNAAIQGLNSQQVTTVNDVVSVKGMVESLTENMTNSVNENRSEHEEKLTVLQAKIRELGVDLESKTSEVASLQEQLDDIPTQAVVSDEQVEMIRRDAMAFQAQRQAEMENELKKLGNRPTKEEFLKVKENADTANKQLESETSAREAVQRLADSRQHDLDAANARFDKEKRELQNQLESRPSREDTTVLEQELSKAKLLANSRQEKIDSLGGQIENEKRATLDAQRLADSRKQDLAKVNEQSSKEKQGLEKQLEGRPSTEEYSSMKGQLSAVQQREKEKQEEANSLNMQLQQEKEKCQKLGSGYQKYKSICDAAVAKEKENGDRRVEYLQQELDNAKETQRVKAAQEEEFRADMQKSWNDEQAKFDAERKDLQRQIREANQRAEAKQMSSPYNSSPKSAVIEESQQQEVASFAQINAQIERPIYANTQDAYCYIQDSLFDESQGKEHQFEYRKPPVAPNSSSKRVTTPSAMSSSPAFMSPYQQQRKSTTYAGGSSAQKRRPSQGTKPIKRKADGSGQISEGYEHERRKSMRSTAPSQASQRTHNTTARANVPKSGGLVSSQGAFDTRVTRSRTDVMAAKFAEYAPSKQSNSNLRQIWK